ncbi:hypothetical protein COI51_30290 [Bacillus toyonensis]|uniref:Uncharacterized protein n=1 Tax=Bacillus wiedmannii TaxID=1890302 RepID=A0A2C5G635_9BACI|nr:MULTISPECIES: hypothetical protein [Bacillus cereus group]PEJ94863.1 hypothetical protein CN690_28445 [Bacillus wiedmannii]PEM13113.1 hypothetical protein CN616_25510 [Bacillus toyonensis]PEM34547.1 hypothetical protein CN598_00470 [Bacillus wiedmannii]PEP31732.1 hypothetical protein CN566_04375 [Bacillus wiedmannii]PFZ47012.1 hypothetical protein COL77_01030 [Bacillus wiedmannii]
MKKICWILCFCCFITFWNAKSPVSYAKEGQVFTYTVDQQALLKFLNSGSIEYKNAMKQGVTLAEFASKKGIVEAELIHYFAIEQKKQLDIALKKVEIDLQMYQDLLPDIHHGIYKTIHYNPNSKVSGSVKK